LVHLPESPVAIETRPIIKREFMGMGAESALIWDLPRSISYEAQFKHALMQVEPGRKDADSLVLRGKSKISLENVSDSEQPLSRI